MKDEIKIRFFTTTLSGGKEKLEITLPVKYIDITKGTDAEEKYWPVIWLLIYNKVLIHNIHQENINDLIPFEYPIFRGLTISFDAYKAQEIAKDLAIFIWYIIQSFEPKNYVNDEQENFDATKKKLNDLFACIYDKQIISDKQIKWLCTQEGFFKSLSKINLHGKNKFSPCRKTKMYALSSLTNTMKKFSIQSKTPKEIEEKLPVSEELYTIPFDPPRSDKIPPKEKIWTKVFGITSGIIITMLAIGLGVLTAGIGTAMIAGLGAIAKIAIGYIDARTLMFSIIAGASFLSGLSLSIGTGLKLKQANKKNNIIKQLEEDKAKVSPFINLNNKTEPKQKSQKKKPMQEQINGAKNKSRSQTTEANEYTPLLDEKVI